MSDQPVKRGRGSTTYDLPDQPLIGGAKTTEPPKGHARNVRFNPMLKFGEKLAGARQFSREQVPPPSLARSPSRGHETTKIEPKSSPLAHAPPPSPRVGPSLPPITTTIKRPRSSPGSPSPRKKVRVESPPTASASTSLATDPALSTTTTNNDNDSASRQPLPVALPSVQKWRLVNYSDSDDE